jgi:hypothetical protein
LGLLPLQLLEHLQLKLALLFGGLQQLLAGHRDAKVARASVDRTRESVVHQALELILQTEPMPTKLAGANSPLSASAAQAESLRPSGRAVADCAARHDGAGAAAGPDRLLEGNFS